MLIGTFNQENALVGAFSVFVKLCVCNLREGSFEAPVTRDRGHWAPWDTGHHDAWTMSTIPGVLLCAQDQWLK